VADNPRLLVHVSEALFDTAALQQQLLGPDSAEGAVATFTGYVRASNDQVAVTSMELEHYPGMTENALMEILREASQRWPLTGAGAVHRIGLLHPGDPIVWVGAASAHRGAAFEACEFIMDYLKTRAPFWKKELGPDGARWVDARDTDSTRADRWKRRGG
jgi:molybdopterin synthase catalytic subunit